MDRNTAADEFVNCVVRRGDQDLYLKPSLAILALIVPLFLGMIISTGIVYMQNESGTGAFRLGLEETILIGGYTAFVLEMAVLSFMIFCVSRSNMGHYNRDTIWMTSLCDYVDSHDGDSTKMRSILRKNRFTGGKMAKAISKTVWVLILLILVGVGFQSHFVESAESVNKFLSICLFSIAPIFILLLIQFLSTIGAVFMFPSNHDSIQSEFTDELARQCKGFGLDIPAMKHVVKRRILVIRIILTVITLGLYLIFYLVASCREMNNHLVSQWAYEEMLIDRIVSFEGGSGIEATAEGQRSKVSKFIDGLM